MQFSRFFALSFSSALALLAAGCGGSTSESEPASRPTIVTFAADPAAVEAGGSTELRWDTEGASAVALTDGTGAAVTSQKLAVDGTLQVTPFETTTYTLVATGKGGEATSSTTVTVTPLPGVVAIGEFLVEPAVVAYDGAITLSWKTSGAESLEITDDTGARYGLGDAAVGQGAIETTARRSTTFRLVARGPGGMHQSEASVQVLAAPTARLTAPATAVEPGAAATLSWSAENAATVRLVDEATGIELEAGDRTSGTVVVRPTVTSRYVLTATGVGGTAKATAVVHVQPKIDRFEVTTAGPVRSGDEVELAWSLRGVSAATIDNGAGLVLPIAAAELAAGTLRVPVGPAGSFVLRAAGGAAEAIRHAAIALTAAPRIRTFVADQAEVSTRADLPALVTLTYFVDGASRLQLIAEPGGLVNLSAQSARAGSVQLPITEATTFRLLAQNEAGLDELVTAVGVVAAPRITTFRAFPARVGAAEAVPLSWSVDDAVAVRIERDGVDIGVDPALTSGAFDDAVAADATYVLRAFNRLGFEIASAPVGVSVGDPIVGDFAVDRPILPAGQQLTFTWSNLGGRSLTVLDAADTVVCSTTSVDEIAAGSCAITAPIIDGTHEYRLQVVNGVGGTTTATVPVVVVGGPLVTSFTATTSSLTLGATVTFSWTVDDDAQGRTPVLSLTDDLGNAYDLSAADPHVGTAVITPAAAGARSFTLRASTPDTTDSTATAPVAVYGVPTLAAAIDPSIVQTQGGTLPATATLSWTTEHGARVEVFSAAGTTALHTTDDAALVASGATTLQLVPGTSQFRVRVTNGAGATVEASVSVSVDPAQIVSFAPVTSQLLVGESTELAWVTNNATSVALSPALPMIENGGTPFVDISSSPTATRVTPSSDDGGQVTVTFPTGFTFPYFGQNRTAVRVMTDGYVSFDTGASSTFTNYELPRSSSSSIHLAALWDDLVRATGGLWWERRTDAIGDHIVIMWKNFQFYDEPSDVNFQIVLRANGNVEYRYGSMTHVANPARANGSSATIGLQNTTGTLGVTRSFDRAVDDGLSNRTFTFHFGPLPTTGTWTVTPRANTTYQLTATNAHSSATAQTQVSVFPAVALATAAFAPAEPEIATPFTISWTATNATAIDVRDAVGNVRCTAAANQLASGSCTVTEAQAGEYAYTVRAQGAIARDVATRALNVRVYAPIAIATFAPAQPTITIGQSTSLSWTTVGASSLSLTANGQPVDLGGRSLAADSIVVSPSATTEYVLTAGDSGRTRTARTSVVVRTATVDSVSATATQVLGGTPVTLSWSTSGASGAFVSGRMPANPATDISSSSSYIDVSTSPTAQRLTLSSNTGYADVTLPAGMGFPYFGERQTAVRVFAYGYLSFNPRASTNSTNAQFPTASGLSNNVHLAPFWDSLSAQATGTVWVDSGSDALGRYVVVQWKNFQFSSSTYNAADLNFEVLLREDGTFEYRYGVMASNAANPTYGNGVSATIGFQDVTGVQGFTVSHNATTFAPIGGKAVRFDTRLPAIGSVAITPTDTTNVRICNSNLGYTECQNQRVVVVKPGDLMISELLVQPAAGPDGEWIEVRNATPWPIDLSGFTLAVSGQSVPVSPGAPLVVQPGGFATLSRGGSGTWSYGNGLTLDDTAGNVVLSSGATEIDRVAWDASWNIPAGATLRLDPSAFNRIVTSNDARAAWCTSGAGEIYDGANAGTPGTLGAGCLNTHYEMDPASARPFIDISATGTALPLLGDSLYSAVPGDVGFAFPFFADASMGTLNATSNGMLVFGTNSSAWTTNAALPASGTPNGGVIAAFWDDLVDMAGSAAQFERRTVGGQQVTIVQWTNFRVYGNAGRLTFQAQLWENGDVVVAIRDLEGGAVFRGSSASIGLENPLGTIGVQYLYNQERAWAGQTISFRKRQP